MILELGKHERSAFYFDCFLSGYDREREYLFIGGYAALKIKNILHFISETETVEDYSTHLQSIEAFIGIMRQRSIQIIESSDLRSPNDYRKNFFNNMMENHHVFYILL